MQNPPTDVDFMEVAPENWIHVGGKLGKKFRWFTERYPFLIHGLSLSIGSPAPLDEQLVRDIKSFMQEHSIRMYSEHLSYCGDDGHLYDLMPIPFTDDAVKYVAGRVQRVQDILEQRIALENVSYYAPTDSSMSEMEFLLAVLDEADCDLMLDINNIVVNSINHRYDPNDFLKRMPADRIRYFHIAGHYVEDEDLRVDTSRCTRRRTSLESAGRGLCFCLDRCRHCSSATLIFRLSMNCWARCDASSRCKTNSVRRSLPMDERRDFQAKQYAFAAHIRDPEHRPAPEGIEDRRMAIYTKLFFNNLRSLLATFFPVLRKLHDDDHWARFIRGFMQQHTAKTPYFLQLPEEFLDFLRNEYEPQDDDHPFLTELAHYEYIELALSVSTQ